MKTRSKEQRRAQQILDAMIMLGFCLDTKRKEVGAITKRLKQEDREALKYLTSDDVQDHIK